MTFIVIIRDYKTPLKDKPSYVRGQFIVQTYTTYHWLASIFDVFLWITLQLQYLLPAILTDLVLTSYFTHAYLAPSKPSLENGLLDIDS